MKENIKSVLITIYKYFDIPKASLCSTIGLLYMKSPYKKQAIDFLTLATFFSKIENNNYDYTELILTLKGLMDKDDGKFSHKLKNVKFDFDDSDDYYGIDNFDEINGFIVESGLDVTSACMDLGMDQNSVNIINLIYAKEYYKQGDIAQGDLFLLAVRNQKNKTEEVNRILDDITRRKQFYQNDEDSYDNKILALLKPDK